MITTELIYKQSESNGHTTHSHQPRPQSPRYPCPAAPFSLSDG